MEERSYSDCELKYIREEGYDPARAAEICAAENRQSEERSGESSKDEGMDEYWDWGG